MQIALLAAVITGLTAPAIGTYIVQRRLALLGDGLGHVALTGVALGILTGTSPLVAAVLVAIAGAIGIELLRTYAKASADVALAMLFYGGIAGGVFLINLSGNSAATLNRYLFGSITTMSRGDVFLVVVLGAIVLLASIWLAPQFFALSHDEEHARVAGVPTRFYGMLIATLAAVTIAVSMRTVGLLLVSALMVMPVAAAQQLRPSFRGTHFLAMGFGLFSAVAGLLISASIDAQPGPTIVLLALAVFAVAATIRGVMSLRRSPEVSGG
ncbi:MAG: metal ABC transporter permease [Actinomycetales bacterium]|nr:metal ABC transporter permease [Actinomycetales bacterium]